MKRQMIWCGIVLCGAAINSVMAQPQIGSQQMSVGGNQSVLSSMQQPVIDAQYQAEKISKSIQTLSDGTVITHETRGVIARDAQGRMREDLYVVQSGQVNGHQQNMNLQSATVGDPVAHTMVIWTSEKTKIAIEMKLPSMSTPRGAMSALLVAPPPPPPPANRPGAIQMIKETAPPPANVMPSVHMGMPTLPALPGDAAVNKADIHTEELGKQSIEGNLVTGKRVTTTIPIGTVGNDRPIVVVHEEWQSPELKIVVKTADSDPRTGEQTMELQGLTRTDPDPALFQVPAGYQVKDMADVLKNLGDTTKTTLQ